MKNTILLLLTLFASFFAKAQQTNDHVKGQILVSLAPSRTPDFLVTKFADLRGTPTLLKADEFVSEAMNIWLLSFDAEKVNENELLRQLKSTPDVRIAQFNHYVTERKKPNDPQYAKQWQWNNTAVNGGKVGADIKAEAAWEVTTGGLTPTGDTIVVAIIDTGIDHEHPDLKGNIWYNRNEIPNNQIDDDGNGYVDDFRGWNPQDKNDNTTPFNNHGTVIAGMIGAKGNNNIGVSGVNWNVKMMMIRSAANWALQNSEVNVIAAYAYALKMRKLYKQTNGQKGAFVVSTNASWGRDNGKPADSPIWCSFYDTLGVHGILNCAATSNSQINVDVVGDLPTTCPSDYLISVQSSDNADNAVSGFGVKSIDIAAPGKNIFSTSINGSYITDSGTSFAAPTVAGSIALLYAAPSKIMDWVKNSPQDAALLMRKTILTTVDTFSALAAKNATKGRLNLGNAVQRIIILAGDCVPPAQITANNVTDTKASISFIKNDSTKQVNLWYRVLGATTWTIVKNINSPFIISALSKCTNYELLLQGKCSKDSSQSNIQNFKTLGCCEAPNLTATQINETNASMTWNSIFGAQKYEIRWRTSGAWTNATTTANQFKINKLDSCTNYEIQIRSICDTTNIITSFSNSLKIKTTGCGTCLDLTYCIPTGNVGFEWIKNVKLNTLNNTSTGAANGYSISAKKTTLGLGNSYTIELSPGYNSSKTPVHFMAWMDFNQDGDFSDANELIYDANKAIDSSATGLITIPWSAKTGSVRLRVGMRAIFGTNVVTPFSPCDNSNLGNTFYGEFEDYCITLNSSFIPCEKIDKTDNKISMGFISMKWDTISGALGYDIYYKDEKTTDWKKDIALAGSYTIAAEDCKTYDVMLQTICQNDLSGFTTVQKIKTYCIIGTNDNQTLFANVSTFPNPFDENLNVSFSTFTTENITLNIYNSMGQIVMQKAANQLDSGNHSINLNNTSTLANGVYYLKISSEKGYTISKIIKM